MTAKLTFWPPETRWKWDILNEAGTAMQETDYFLKLLSANEDGQKKRLLTSILEEIPGPFQQMNGLYDIIAIPTDGMRLRRHYNPRDPVEVALGRFHNPYLELFLAAQGFINGRNMKGVTLGYALERIKETFTLGEFLTLWHCPLIKEIMLSADYFALRK
ncbi:hypothetical protein HY501_03615 [Candidatus Woesearchaeota archaeon]|nr:hypothetical protein [Candidatus Woesearchaeota archaeon]